MQCLMTVLLREHPAPAGSVWRPDEGMQPPEQHLRRVPPQWPGILAQQQPRQAGAGGGGGRAGPPEQGGCRTEGAMLRTPACLRKRQHERMLAHVKADCQRSPRCQVSINDFPNRPESLLDYSRAGSSKAPSSQLEVVCVAIRTRLAGGNSTMSPERRPSQCAKSMTLDGSVARFLGEVRILGYRVSL